MTASVDLSECTALYKQLLLNIGRYKKARHENQANVTGQRYRTTVYACCCFGGRQVDAEKYYMDEIHDVQRKINECEQRQR